MPSTRLYGPSAAPGAAGTLAQNTSGAIAAVLPATQTVLNTAETVIVNPSVSSSALVVNIPTGSLLEQKPFTLQASGYLNNGTSSTVTIKLYNGTSTTVGRDTLLGSSGAITAFAGKAPSYAKAKLIYDSVSGKLQGTVKFMVNNTLVAETAVSNVVTGISNVNATGVVTSFVLSVTFGTAGTQVISVNDFAIFDDNGN